MARSDQVASTCKTDCSILFYVCDSDFRLCRGCLNPVTSAVRTSVDIGASAKLELADKFCYLGDMLSVDGDADAAVEARIRIRWNKFRQLVPLLTNKDLSDYERNVVQQLCAKQHVAWK